MASPQYNMKNPAVKRILQEIKEVQSDTSGDIMAEALENDIFEWHFCIRGPPDTEFEGGIYHGRILLPAEYPFKPPAFMMLTPSGRFETGVKICLSISAHHPEHWQPSWSVRTALTALVAFMPSPGNGALGALDYTKEERVKLAVKSRQEVPRHGSADRQRIIDDMHARMLTATPQRSSLPSTSSAPPPPPAEPSQPPASVSQQADTDQPAQHQPEQPTTTSTQTAAAEQASSPARDAPVPASIPAPDPAQPPGTQQSLSTPKPSGPPLSTTASPARPPAVGTHPVSPTRPAAAAAGREQVTQAAPPASPDTWGLTVLAVALGVLILAILMRKVLVAAGYEVSPLVVRSARD